MGVRRVALGGDILGSRRNPRSITATITTKAPAPTTTRPYITPTTKPTATAAATATATNYWYLQHAKTRRPPTISSGRSKLTSRVGQKGGGILVLTARKTRRPPTIGRGRLKKKNIVATTTAFAAMAIA